MMIDALLVRLDGVQQRGTRWAARCPVPAHGDTSPSLSVSEGECGILVKCWAGCSLQEICDSLGLHQKDLFFDALDTDPRQRGEAARKRAREQRQRERHTQQQEALIDALREADSFVQSRRGIDISTWDHDHLHDELNALADAYHLLEREALDG